MSDKRMRVLVVGVLVICLLSLLLRDDGDRIVGLTDMLTLLGVWCSAVWLCPRCDKDPSLYLLRFYAVLKKVFKLLFWTVVVMGLPAVAAACYLGADNRSLSVLFLMCIGSWVFVVSSYGHKRSSFERDPNPAYPWNQPKRRTPILPGASPEMMKAIQERNDKINRR